MTIGCDDYAEKSLLLVGTGGSKRRAVLERLRSLGLRKVVCLNHERNWADPYVDDWILADAVHPGAGGEQALDRYLALHSDLRLDGIMTYDEYSVVLASHLARRSGRIGLAPSVAETVKNKYAFRRACLDRGLPAPAVSLAPLGGSLDASGALGLRFPVVMKPVEGASSVFVRKADNAAELRAAVASYEASVRDTALAQQWRDRSLLVEEYLEGDEVDIDMLVQGGEVKYLAITDNFPSVEPHFLENGGQIPSALPTCAQQALGSMANDVVRALSVSDACVHFEAKMTATGPVPIEVNLRLGGAEVYTFNKEAWGVDLLEGAVRIALGLAVPRVGTGAPLRYLVSAPFNPPRAGVIRAIRLEPWVEASPDLAELVMFKRPGERIEVPPRGYEYSGWIVAHGGTREEAHANVARLGAGVHVEIEEDPGDRPEEAVR